MILYYTYFDLLFGTEVEFMEVLNIAVCEDDPNEQKNIMDILNEMPLNINPTLFKRGEELLSVYRPNAFDLLLMDIYMDGMSGIETVKEIKKIDNNVPIAFISASTAHTLESYRLSALKYIEKPLNKKDIEDILKLALMNKNNIPSLRIYINRSEEKIPFSNILYLEQLKRKVSIYLKDGTIIQIYGKLSDLMPQLSEHNFICTHKSFCVNLAFVRHINRELKCFVIENGVNVPIRRESMSDSKRKYEDFLFNKTREMPYE